MPCEVSSIPERGAMPGTDIDIMADREGRELEPISVSATACNSDRRRRELPE